MAQWQGIWRKRVSPSCINGVCFLWLYDNDNDDDVDDDVDDDEHSNDYDDEKKL